MNPSADPLLRALREPSSLAVLEPEGWEQLLALARATNLAGRLPRLVGMLDAPLPVDVDVHMRAMADVAEHHRRSIHWEVNRIECALRGFDGPVVLLKGAAYAMADLPLAAGRTANDVDILVSRSELAEVERALRRHGWQPLNDNEYDDYYYRTWMHELPPLRHAERGTVIDVHHTILPLTGRLRPDATLLLAAARRLSGQRFSVLAPADMVLHSATHLFHDGDLGTGLRDLADVDQLLRHFAAQEDSFYAQLVPRARQLDLARPLHYALRFTSRLLRTEIPPDVARSAAEAGAPHWPIGRIMDMLVPRALLPSRGLLGTPSSQLARCLLYLRAHWLRMPPRLLARHLTHKLARRWKRAEDR